MILSGFRTWWWESTRIRPLHLAALSLPPGLFAVATTVAVLSGSSDRLILSLLMMIVITGLGTMVGLLALVSKRITQLEVAFNEIRSSIGALYGLTGLLSETRYLLPALEGSALGLKAGHALASLVNFRSPKIIVELGPGSSTVLLLVLRERRKLSFDLYCIEHDDEYFHHLKTVLEDVDSSRCHVILAPLEALSLHEWHGKWYATDIVNSLPSQIDLLIVDGPPNYLGGDLRYPAYPVLQDRLHEGSLIFVDDTHRPAERSMLGRWMSTDEMRIVEDAGTYVVLEVVR